MLRDNQFRQLYLYRNYRVYTIREGLSVTSYSYIVINPHIFLVESDSQLVVLLIISPVSLKRGGKKCLFCVFIKLTSFLFCNSIWLSSESKLVFISSLVNHFLSVNLKHVKSSLRYFICIPVQ